MTTLLDDSTSIPAIAYKAEPLSVAEIDAHPDRARIWATVAAMRKEHDAICTLAYDEGHRAGSNDEP